MLDSNQPNNKVNPSQTNDTTSAGNSASEIMDLGIVIGSSWRQFQDEYRNILSGEDSAKLTALQEECSNREIKRQGAYDEMACYEEFLNYKQGFLNGIKHQKELQEAGRA